jgi:hypothetical protein
MTVYVPGVLQPCDVTVGSSCDRCQGNWCQLQSRSKLLQHTCSLHAL